MVLIFTAQRFYYTRPSFSIAEIRVKVLCDLPTKPWRIITYNRWSLNTGLIIVKSTAQRYKADRHTIYVII